MPLLDLNRISRRLRLLIRGRWITRGELSRRKAAWAALPPDHGHRETLSGVHVYTPRPAWADPAFADTLARRGASERLVSAARRAADPLWLPPAPDHAPRTVNR